MLVDQSNLLPLTKDVLQSHLADFLCDDSSLVWKDKALADATFEPDTFSACERLSVAYFLDESERDMESYLEAQLVSLLRRLEDQEEVQIRREAAVVAYLKRQVMRLFEYEVDGKLVSARIYNPELGDVLERVVAYCITGDPKTDLPTHRRFNEYAERLIPLLIERHLVHIKDPKELLAYSIASGLIGLDLKGAEAAASRHVSAGIPLLGLQRLSDVDVADEVFAQLRDVVQKGLAVDDWGLFVDNLSSSSDCKLLWFTDDVIETFFDLLLLGRLLHLFPRTTITIVPRQGRHKNDASYLDVIRFLAHPVLEDVAAQLTRNRLRVLNKGPRMSTINLSKLSKDVTHEILDADGVVIKGCRGFEMIQGGINALTYTAFVVARQFSEAEIGLDARENPLVFFQSAPGEYAYWGFKSRGKRWVVSPDGRRIPVTLSTLMDHRRRLAAETVEQLIAELIALRDLHKEACPTYAGPYSKELHMLTDRLVEKTKQDYNTIAWRFAELREDWPRAQEIHEMERLLEIARERRKEGSLGDEKGRILVLDVGTGHGRDLRFLHSIEDIVPIGIDNASAFMQMLAMAASDGKIPQGSFMEMDMRALQFPAEYFDVVRHNASIVHLPLLPCGVGVDEALAESCRVLKPRGLLFIKVKEGGGLKYVDTEEGLGARVFQYYTEESLLCLLNRSGFRCLELTKVESERPTGVIAWLVCIVEKPAEGK
ncbi:methyltransferase domain-containing protein [Candidatus Bipolaricaulota bacterium]|nr:methyltransferase domain-containing protein [Candidatus Bipolaricaulota bacterium]